MNIYICLIYRKEPYIFEKNKISNKDILPILPMLNKNELQNIQKDIENSIIEFKNMYYENIFPKQYMYKYNTTIDNINFQKIFK